MSPKMYRQRIYNMGIEDMEINVSSLENSMRTLRTINDMGKVLKKIRHNLRIDIRIMRMDYIKKIQNINELADKKGFFGKKMSDEKIFKKKKSLKKERKNNIAAYEIIETMVENYLTQIEDSRIYINNQIQSKVR
jgi:hypothetical protein